MDQPDKPQNSAFFVRANDESPGTISGIPLLLLVLAAGIIPGFIAYGMGIAPEAQVVAIVLGILFMVLIIARPFFGLVVYIGLLYARPEEMIPALAGMRLTLIIALVTSVGMALYLILERKPVASTPMIAMMIGFTVVGIISGALHGVTSDAITDFSRLLAQVLLILNLVNSPERYRTFITVLIFFTSYLALYAVYLYFSGQVTTHTLADGSVIFRSKATGIFEDPNDLAATMIPGVVLSLARIWREQGARKLIYILLMSAMIWAILLSSSRGGMLGMLVAVGSFALSFTKNKVLAVVLAVVMGLAFLFVAPDRMKNLDSSEASANERLEFWHTGLEVLVRKPLTGVGYKAFPDVNEGHVAHNSFVNCFGELGFPGYFFWMGCIYYGFKRRPVDTSDQEKDLDAEDAEIETLDPDSVKKRQKELEDRKYDLMGAQLTLLGYLAATFWITRTYTPVMYIILCLPIAQQIAIEKKPAPWTLNKDIVAILGYCLAMVVFIYLFTLRR